MKPWVYQKHKRASCPVLSERDLERVAQGFSLMKKIPDQYPVASTKHFPDTDEAMMGILGCDDELTAEEAIRLIDAMSQEWGLYEESH